MRGIGSRPYESNSLGLRNAPLIQEQQRLERAVHEWQGRGPPLHGQLTVYDLEQLRRGPRKLLSSCDCGVGQPTGADEVLGLANSLIPLGTVSIVASVVPVNDAAVVPLMVVLHDLGSG
jgi:CHAT domain